jgi:DNA mismatch endonuclease (patch repair protein)
MRDPLSKAQRSRLMARVKARGNKSTELELTAALKRYHVVGWRRHPKNVLGRPDFYFRTEKLAVFVDGCFWHACPKCGRLPKSRVEFWTSKITGNRLRDKRVGARLRGQGIAVLRFWEHEVGVSAKKCINKIVEKLWSQRRDAVAAIRLSEK